MTDDDEPGMPVQKHQREAAINLKQPVTLSPVVLMQVVGILIGSPEFQRR